jgi:YidC/Oxa1 family membrane protein insertase
MDRRVLLMTGVSAVLVLLWIVLFPQAKKTETPTPAPQAQPAATPTPTPTPTKAAAEPAKPDVAKPDAAKPEVAKPTPVKTTFEQDKRYRATFTSEEAAPESWVLLDRQYKEDNPKRSNKTAEPIDLVRTHVPYLPLKISFPSSAIKLPPDAVWTLQPRTDDRTLVYTWEDDKIRVEKRFEQVPNTYEVRLKVTVENKSDKPVPHYLQVQLHSWQDPNVKQGGFLSKRVNTTSGVWRIGGKVKRATFEDLLKKGGDELGDVGWVALSEQYFLIAAAVPQSEAAKRCNIFAATDGTMSAIITMPQREVGPQQKTEYEAALFLGPRMLSQLDAVKVAGQSAHLGDVMDYPIWGTTEWLARPMLAVLKAIHFVLPNWGVAIIVLTILIKALTWFPTQSSMKSMKAMAKLKPEMDKLKERFGDDKNALNLAMMELYKKHGVNPLGGCLPILIQMPVYIALYSMLGNSVELYRSPFVGWIRDLTAADPYYVLPALTGVLMFVQQKTQPTPPDPQQKVMMYMMPVMFTGFSIFLASGLTLYILTNTILTFLQQMWMNRHDKPARPTAVTTPAKPAKPAKPARA